MKNLVFLTGAGISAESGMKTFRDADGLWEEHDVMEVASIMGWHANMELVLRFYNERRRQLASSEPNDGHRTMASLEKHFNVTIITQNVDNLHERAGSTNILHLHGELTKVRSTGDERDIRDIGYNALNEGDNCAKGYQLRPHIVWFGEAVPAMTEAARVASKADIFVVVGTSLNVYPAASLVGYAPDEAPMWLIDPSDVYVPISRKVEVIKEKAVTGMSILAERLLKEYA